MCSMSQGTRVWDASRSSVFTLQFSIFFSILNNEHAPEHKFYVATKCQEERKVVNKKIVSPKIPKLPVKNIN